MASAITPTPLSAVEPRFHFSSTAWPMSWLKGVVLSDGSLAPSGPVPQEGPKEVLA